MRSIRMAAISAVCVLSLAAVGLGQGMKKEVYVPPGGAAEPAGALALSKTTIEVTAEVDTAAKGTPISTLIYGVGPCDRKLANDMGITTVRLGGNPISTYNWVKGFDSAGADWFFINRGGPQGGGENNWWAKAVESDRKYQMVSYLSLPMMGRVAKDATSVAFDTKKYPDQENWVGKEHPDWSYPNAGNGRRFAKDKDGNYVLDKDGKKKVESIVADPDDTSEEMSPAQQCELMADTVKRFGTSDKGGVKYIAMDNEPGLWHETHRGMRTKGCSYDELWQRTLQYGEMLKKIDPGVKLAGPTSWGWSEYFYSGLDGQNVGLGKYTWDNLEDYNAHGKEPLTKWYLKKNAEYKKANGKWLIDVLDFHFYPQANTNGKALDPKAMEDRVQETRVLWDPTYKDPSWMGKETGGIIKVVRLMKEWIAECCPGLGTAIGEYSFGGDGDASGAITQAEILGVFAREGVDLAYYWCCPGDKSPTYYGFRMMANHDGKRAAFAGDYLTAKVDQPTDVSVHVARKDGELTFVVINKRSAKDAKVTIKLSAKIPEQGVFPYAYLQEKWKAGVTMQEAVQYGGDKIALDVPAMSMVRFSVRTK